MKLAVGIIAALAALVASGFAEAAAAPGCPAAGRSSPYRAGTSGSKPARAAAPPVAPGVATGYPTSETTLAVTSKGATVFSPANSENTLAVSTNGGSRRSVPV